MKKRASGKKKIRVEIWVALIGLVGGIVTAIFASPVLKHRLGFEPDGGVRARRVSTLNVESQEHRV